MGWYGAGVGQRTRFSVDVAGLLAALTEQFPDPLLCVRELIQNAADAKARRIEVDVAFDAGRDLVRISVRDDGRGMGASEVEAYLTIGFSAKDPAADRGRFGVGKLSPYALALERMVVETSDGRESHRLVFHPDGSGAIERIEPARAAGTSVRVFERASAEEAEQVSERVHAIARNACGQLDIPLFVNGVAVNHDGGLATPYQIQVREGPMRGSLGLARDSVRTLLAGGIVLESGAGLLGEAVSYVLDDPRLAPTLSRRGVRRDRALERLLRLAQGQLSRLEASAAATLGARIDAARPREPAVERGLGPDDRVALDWLRGRLFEAEARSLVDAPLLETVDGDLVSVRTVRLARSMVGAVPCARVPLGAESIVGFADRGLPVLLLYRDLEDFLDRIGVPVRVVEAGEGGREVERERWSSGEQALLTRPALGRSTRFARIRRTLRRILRHPRMWLAALRLGGRNPGGEALDLEGLELGLIEVLEDRSALASGRICALMGTKLLLDRHHPTVLALVRLAALDADRARMMLESLIATDPAVAAGRDPRRLEWSVVTRSVRWLTRGDR